MVIIFVNQEDILNFMQIAEKEKNTTEPIHSSQLDTLKCPNCQHPVVVRVQRKWWQRLLFNKERWLCRKCHTSFFV